MTDVQVLSVLFCFGFENGAAKQQLQKWELKFVTELEPLEGASPVMHNIRPVVLFQASYHRGAHSSNGVDRMSLGNGSSVLEQCDALICNCVEDIVWMAFT